MDMMITVTLMSAVILALAAFLYARERRIARRLRVQQFRAKVEDRLNVR